MPNSLPIAAEESFLSRGFSRRQLGKIASVLTAGAALPFYNEAAFAQRAAGEMPMPAGAVRISSNENPLGPCNDALEAISKVAKLGGRYSPNDEMGQLTNQVAVVENLKPEYISVFAGSSDPLLRTV